ncbi:MAG: histidinol-phosphate transaminase [Thermoleophilaceae bacterium]|nr:histidinol-phosphate transaminase [Thermoleophilaceae bacterium]
MPLRPALGDVSPYRPQKPIRQLQEELGLDRIVKLASNEGAFGPLPAAVAAFEATAGELNRYPDGGGTMLREALAERHGVALEQVVLGNGADELIRFCAHAVLDPGERAAFPWPSFPSYVAAVTVANAEAVRVPLLEGLQPDIEALAASGAKLLYLANPNNPTGQVADFTALVGDGRLVVLDEAYAEFADPEPDGIGLIRAGAPNLAVLRTFSKVYGLAALRIGYAVASPDIADALDRVRPIFNANQPAQEAALASLHEQHAVGGRIEHVRGAREQIRTALTDAGLDARPSQANFVYAEVPGGDGPALARALLQEGVAIRALDGFGAPQAVRVTVGTDEENGAFAQALARVAGREGG